MLSIGHKKPKLENVTIEQFNIANLRIFYELLTSSNLPSAADVRDYLSYSIKVLELARKYTWESVLKYDDEYRILQHTYGYPWSFDNSHLDEVMLLPCWASSSVANTVTRTRANSNSTNNHTNSSSPPVGTHTALGVEICQNFNRQKGCQKSDCKFAHYCNRKVGQKVCGKADHPGYMHNTADK